MNFILWLKAMAENILASISAVSITALKEWLENICMSIPAIAIAAMGGAISYLSTRNGCRRFSWYWFIVGTISAAFVGILMHCILESCGAVPSGVKSAVIGISGYASNDVLLILKKRVMDALKGGNWK